MQLPDIRSLIPHAGPMVLLDRVVAADGESLCAEVEIRSGGLFSTPHGIGGWVGIEYMAQAIAAYAGYETLGRGEAVKIGFLLGVRRYDCSRSFFTPGTVLKVYVRRLLVNENGLGSFECHIDDRDGEVATATLTVFQPADINEFLAGLSE